MHSIKHQHPSRFQEMLKKVINFLENEIELMIFQFKFLVQINFIFLNFEVIIAVLDVKVNFLNSMVFSVIYKIKMQKICKLTLHSKEK